MSVMTEERFLQDVAGHQMFVLHEDDVYRHIRFRKPGTGDMHFDLITWPGSLCYTGDMGTFVFERTRDMFEFFRRPERCRYSIDMRYWAEKVQAGDNSGAGNGVKKFSKEKFDANVRRWLEDFIKSEIEEAEGLGEVDLCTRAMNDLRAEVESEVIGADDSDVRCYDAANDFRFDANDSEAWRTYYGGEKTFEFVDFWEVDHTEYTGRFQWCCLALSWAMQVYDKAKTDAGRDPRVADMFANGGAA